MIYEIGLPRKTITSKEEELAFINRNNGTKNLYKTVYKFERLNTFRPDYNSAIVDKLFFDFDNSNCWNETNKLHNYLIQENIKHFIVMSGRGYHLYILILPLSPQNIKSCIYNAQKYFVDKLNLKCDGQVMGDVARLRRIPNTFNIKAKRFCIPLTKEQFKSGDEVIKIAASKQNFVKDINISENLFDISKFDYESERVHDIIEDDYKFKSSSNADYMNNCDNKIKQLLAKKELGWKERYLVILYFKERGFTIQEVFNILKDNLSEKKFRHCVYEENQLKYLFSRDDLMFPEECGIKVYK